MTMSLPSLNATPVAIALTEGSTEGAAAPIDAVFAGLLATMLNPHGQTPAPTSPTSTPSFGDGPDTAVDADAGSAGTESVSVSEDETAVTAPSLNAIVAGAIALQTMPNMAPVQRSMMLTAIVPPVVAPATEIAAGDASSIAAFGAVNSADIATQPVAEDDPRSSTHATAAFANSDETVAELFGHSVEAASNTPHTHEDVAADTDVEPQTFLTRTEVTPAVERDIAVTVEASTEPARPVAIAHATSAVAALAIDPGTQVAVSPSLPKAGRSGANLKAIVGTTVEANTAPTTDFATAARHMNSAPPLPSIVSATPGVSQAAPVAAPPAIDQILEAVAPLQHSGDGNYELTLELRPHDLGRVEITVLMRDGVLSMHMSADHAEARQLLRDHVEHLRGLLNTSGVTTGSFDIADQGHHQPQSNAQSLNEQLAHSRDERADQRAQTMNPMPNDTVNQITNDPALATHVSSTREASTRVDVHA